MKVLVVDDEPEFRHIYESFFSQEDDFECVGVAADGRQGVALWRERHPDVTLMDLDMPVMSGEAAIRVIHAEDPAACVVAMTVFDDGAHVGGALAAGVSGYLLKGCSPEEIKQGVLDAFNHQVPLAAGVRTAVANLFQASSPSPDRLKSATDREVALLTAVVAGLSNEAIAVQAHISVGSVKVALNRLFKKYAVASRTDLAVEALRLGIVPLHPLLIPNDGQATR